MKKIAVILAAVLIGVTCMAQRPGSPNRGGASYSRPSAPATRSYNYSRPATRSVAPTTHRPAPTSNAVRRDNGNVYRGYSNSRPQPAPSVNRGDRVYHRPGQYSPNPPAHRPAPHGMHPLPPRFHPIHHNRIMHMHHCVCHNWYVPNLYWYGYWTYVHTYPYEQVVVYMRDSQPTIEVVAICSDDTYVYTLYKDNASNTMYFTISDESDNILVKTEVSRKYCRLATDENGVWLLRKNDKHPMYMLYQNGTLYQYEED